MKGEGMGTHVRKNLLRGLLALLPFWLTWWVVTLIYTHLDIPVQEWLLNLPRPIWGLGTALLLVLLYLFGLLASNIFGERLFALVGRWSERIPIVRTTWSVGRQIAKSLSPDDRGAFERAVLIPFLSSGQWTVGFVCGLVHDRKTGGTLLRCFIPMPPNPATGWVVLVDESAVRDPCWSVEEAMQMVLTLGMAGPDHIGEGTPGSRADDDPEA
ncbi:DUF502 domain-containing protein [bacterium]|nr:DUF502 domain-containing protein [bacterium]